MAERKDKLTGKRNTPYHRIIVKFGTSLLTGGTDCLDEEAISKLVSQVARLQQQGLELLVVSSGAIAAGRYKLGLDEKRRDVAFKQVLAAVGQGQLMNIYDQLFSAYDITVAQALLTRTDLADRAGYLNARNTLMALMELKVLAIVNENDVVAVDEIQEAKFGDNDNLSAMVANLVDADLLLILSDIAGLHTADPKRNSDARLIPLVENIDREIENLMADASGTLGTGGMATKIEAARLATAAGVTVIVADGREPDIILDAVAGKPVGTRFSPAPAESGNRSSKNKE
ncbi:MAG: glutamate 5-kinase [Dehalococcoidales bacterium]